MAVITISREMGTGAYHLAEELSQRLKYTLVDGSRLISVASRYGLQNDLLQLVDEKPPSYITAEDRKRAAVLTTIELMLLDFARKGNAILYGRGGQDLLKGCDNVLKLRFIAEFDERVERFAEREWIDPDMAHSLIRRSDHQRGGFIHFYYNRDWRDPLGYDMVFNTSRMSENTIIEAVATAVRDPRLKEAEKRAADTVENTHLMKRIEIALLNSPELDYHPFKILVDRGAVHLSGYVTSEPEKRAAIRVVEGVKGVKSLEADITVANYKAYKNRT